MELRMSAETDALIAFLRHTKVPHRVTSTTGGTHSAGSRHYLGLAVDFAGPVPGRNTPELLAIFRAFAPIERQLYELIYSGATYSIKDGLRVPRYAISGHWDHVHVSVNKGFRWYAPAPAPVGGIAVGAPLEVDVQLLPIRLDIAIDANGNGWTKVPYSVERIVGLSAHSGTRPGADGAYDKVADRVGMSPEDGGTIIVVQGGTPGTVAPCWFHVIVS